MLSKLQRRGTIRFVAMFVDVKVVGCGFSLWREPFCCVGVAMAVTGLLLLSVCPSVLLVIASPFGGWIVK